MFRCCITNCSRIESIVTNFGTHLHVELQQRGTEYAQLFTKHSTLRPAIMERIPPLEHRPSAASNNTSVNENGSGLTNGRGFSNGDDLSLMDDLGSLGGTSELLSAPKDSVRSSTKLQLF